jgi:hypothetical protein
MLGETAFSELPIGTAPDSNVNALGNGSAVAAAFGVGLGSADLSKIGAAFPLCIASAQGSAIASALGTVVAKTAAHAAGRIETDLGLTGIACSAASANAVGRIDGSAIVAAARTRVLPQPQASSEVLPLSVGALTVVRGDLTAHASVLPLVHTAVTSVLSEIRAASRVALGSD